MICSPDNIINLGDTYYMDYNIPINDFTGGGIIGHVFSYQIPSNLSGTCYWGGYVDAGTYWTESNENNNALIGNSVIIQGSPPTTPILSYPANGSTLNDPTPDLTWNSTQNTNYYWIQVDNNSNFSSPESESSNVNGFVWTPNPLSDGTYYWHVKAHGINGSWSDWSSTWSFTIGTLPDIDVMPTSITINQPEVSTGNSPSHVFVDNSMNNPINLAVQGQNELTDHIMGCIIPDSIVEYWKNHASPMFYPDAAITTIDWSANDSPVKQQGGCGSCWAFAATAYIENLGVQTDLSEQAVVSCSGAGDCSGGYFHNALVFYQSTGIPHETCYPYIAMNGNCNDMCQNPTFKERITTVSNELWGIATVDNLKSQLQSGPLVVRMLVPTDNTFNGYPGYTGGIYNYNGGVIPQTEGHAVLLVGYDDAQQCFKVKNSWGPSWGESGYFRIAYDDVTDDVQFGSYAVNGSGVYTQNFSSDSFTISNLGNGNLTITSILDNEDWLTISGYPSTPFSIFPSGSQNISVDVNWSLVGSSTQTGIITIASNDPDEPSVTVQVTAIPASCTLTVTPPNQPVAYTAGAINFTVATNCSWTAVSNQTWCTVTPSGIGNGTIVATYSQNPNTSQRIANITVTVTGLTPVVVTVTQAGAPCTLTVTPPNQPVAYTAGTTNFAVASNCSWTAVSDQIWCQVTTSSGNENGLIVADYEGNTSTNQRIANITITALGTTGSPQIVTVTQSGTFPAHFPFDGGNPADPVWTIYLSQATLDDMDLLPMDEIAIFDGSAIVGAFRLTEVLTPGNVTDNYITAFKTLTNGPGYAPGHSYSFKCWDADTQMEHDYANVSLLNPWGDAYTGNVFPENDGEYSIADIDFLTAVTHSYNLNTGYQFISSYVTPSNPDMPVVLAELMNNNLSFVRSSGGDMFRKLGPNWVNNIGNWVITEGYLIKMNAPDDFGITGTPVDPLTPINLNTGYQFISYFHDYPMDASAAFAGIMNDNLSFIRNSGGDMLRKLGPNWVNNIGNVNPGEGYLVKMNAPATLIYPAGTKSESIKNNVAIRHFDFEGGNAADPVYTIYISDATINGYSLQSGDEIGVFDGQTLVGSLALTQTPTSENQFENAIPVFATLNSGEGFMANHPVTFKLWSQGQEYEGINVTLSNPYGDAYTGNVFPNSDGVYSIASLTATLTGINSLDRTEVAVYPNPSNGTFTLELKSVQSQNFDVKIFNSLGVVVYQQLNIAANGKYSAVISSGDLPEGIYTLTVTGKDANYIRKIVIKK
jgi:hypothetical protein